MGKPQILLLTHGGWGMSLMEGVRMVIGAVDFVKEAPLRPQVTFQEYLALVREAADAMPDGSLILTDMFGGTTTNAGALVGREKNIRVFSGLNAPLLIEACLGLMEEGKIDFDSVLETGETSVIDVIEKITKSLEEKEVEKNG